MEMRERVHLDIILYRAIESELWKRLAAPTRSCKLICESTCKKGNLLKVCSRDIPEGHVLKNDFHQISLTVPELGSRTITKNDRAKPLLACG